MTGAAAADPARAVSVRPPDRGFTLIDVTIAIGLLGVLLAALSAALVITLKAAPVSAQRIDDARATRGLATWLAHDATSAPPHEPAEPQGGLVVGDGPGSNLCAAPGAGLVQLVWREDAAVQRMFVAGYRVLDGAGDDGSTISRITCVSTNGGSYQRLGEIRLVSGLDPAHLPTVSLVRDANGDVAILSLRMVGVAGETVVIDTSSRNPAESFS